jgi:hypothetical protein
MRCLCVRRSTGSGTLKEIEAAMATRNERQRQIVEPRTEARQAASVLALLTVSTGLAVLILGVPWFAFFRA